MSELINKKIVDVRSMTIEERNAEGWDTNSSVICIVLDDGSKLYPSGDEEGNYGGSLFGVTSDGKNVSHYVMEE